jgi:hypothetical protein
VPDPVQLTDLDVITRYSIAVRRASADREELIEILRGDLAWLERGRLRGRLPEPDEVAPEPIGDPVEVEAAVADEPPVASEPVKPPAAKQSRPPLRRMPAKVTPARKATAKKAAARKTSSRRSAR